MDLQGRIWVRICKRLEEPTLAMRGLRQRSATQGFGAGFTAETCREECPEKTPK